jgi:hypothetical protein
MAAAAFVNVAGLIQRLTIVVGWGWLGDAGGAPASPPDAAAVVVAAIGWRPLIAGGWMRRLRAFEIALVIAVSITVVGCSAGSGSNASILGGDFRAKVLAACAHSVSLHTAMGPFPLSSFNPSQPDPLLLPSIAELLREDQDRYATFVSDLTAFGSPPTGTALWTAVLDAAKQHATIAADQATAAATSDAAAFAKDFTAGTAAQASFLAAINAVGVPECAPVDR